MTKETIKNLGTIDLENVSIKTMKNRKFVANIGTVDFSKVELMNSMELFIDIANLSEDLREKADKAIEQAKAEYVESYKEIMEIRNETWGKSGVRTTPQLHVILPEDSKIQYELYIYFEDMENPDLFDAAYLEINLNGHENQLKKLVIEALIEKFF